MARKVSITVGLPGVVIAALEKVSLQLYKRAVEHHAPVVAGSRSKLIELLLVEALQARGIDIDWKLEGANDAQADD